MCVCMPWLLVGNCTDRHKSTISGHWPVICDRMTTYRGRDCSSSLTYIQLLLVRIRAHEANLEKEKRRLYVGLIDRDSSWPCSCLSGADCFSTGSLYGPPQPSVAQYNFDGYGNTVYPPGSHQPYTSYSGTEFMPSSVDSYRVSAYISFPSCPVTDCGTTL